jgi:hypothetical protein
MAAKQKLNIRVLLHWLFVMIPLLWGVLKTVEKSMSLFN